MDKNPKDQETDTTKEGYVIRMPTWGEVFRDLDKTAKPQKKLPLRKRLGRPKQK
jgi:hypothetical protein